MRVSVLVVFVVSALVWGCGDKKPEQPPGGGTVVPPSTQVDVEGVKKKLSDSLRKAADFIKSQRKPDGQVGGLPGVASTSVCALALATSPLKDEYKEFIEKSTEFLLKFLKSDGSINDEQGYIVYKTSIVLSFLCRLPKSEKEKHAQQIAAMVDYLLKAQYWNEMAKEDLHNGGWGYDEKKKEPRSDMSNTSFVVQALHDAEVPKEHPVWKRVTLFVSRSQNNPETNDLKIEGFKNTSDGGFRYGPKMTRSSVVIKNPDGTESYPSYGAMTYAGLLSMIYAFVDKNDDRVKSAMNWIRRNYTLDENPGMSERRYEPASKQGLFYYYMTLAKALFHYGERYLLDSENNKHDWAAELVEKLVSLQKEDGSWVNENDRWYESDPSLVTSYAIIALSYASRALNELK
ncbi:MAG: terpene cyclase/mutase family protein [Planctomycetota bacterium]|nr:terpene cyclase/mutase family protein [Planctomycetota bacterium]